MPPVARALEVNLAILRTALGEEAQEFLLLSSGDSSSMALMFTGSSAFLPSASGRSKKRRHWAAFRISSSSHRDSSPPV
jgi:hypothetical protein